MVVIYRNLWCNKKKDLSQNLSIFKLGTTNHGPSLKTRLSSIVLCSLTPPGPLLESLSNEDGERERERDKTIDLNYRIQLLHVGMQRAGRFSAVVARNKT